tara:strand:- start:128 stop:349 length:222 start_codon:yes stop_codon:yes gene_type:complete
MENDGKIQCECGSTQYGYYADQGLCFVCFKCGRFATDGFDPFAEELFKQNPMILLNLIAKGHLKPLKEDEDYK